jgi:hypothetical protein
MKEYLFEHHFGGSIWGITIHSGRDDIASEAGAAAARELALVK